MVEKIDIYRTADILIKEHGDKAEDFALEKMGKFLAAGDAKASGFWLGVAQAITDLQNTKVKGNLH